MDQVEQYGPPPNFVKEKDSRTGKYRDQFDTDECWELDALEPNVIADLIRDAIEPMIDQAKWKKALASEKRGQAQLKKLASNWTKVKKVI
jgi:hypothetical protein